jgi:hypothetical protein
MVRAPILKTVNGILFSLAMSVPGIAETAPFPAPLLGKSVTLEWTTNEQRKFEDPGEVTFPTFSDSLRIYVSTAGRAFSREVFVRTGGGGGGQRGSPSVSDQAPDDSRSSTGDQRIVHFDRGALLVDNHLIAGTRRISITFGAGYGSCNARITYDRPGDGGPIRRKLLNGRRYELVSIQASVPSCSIMSGNVLVEQ